jgi:hypothetical protein
VMIANLEHLPILQDQVHACHVKQVCLDILFSAYNVMFSMLKTQFYKNNNIL